MERFGLPSLTSLCRGVAERRRGASQGRKAGRVPGPPGARGAAPHPVARGTPADAVCPITGVSAAGEEDPAATDLSPRGGLAAGAEKMYSVMKADLDVAAERMVLEAVAAGSKPKAFAPVAPRPPRAELPLNVINGKHVASPQTRDLVRSVGLESLLAFTSRFYERSFADVHVDRFIAHREDPHAQRFAKWIVEKLGDGTPWTEERRTRPKKQMAIGREVREVAFDRSSAHFAAWHSPKREPEKFGQHFRVDDARVWMRLHFWAARETGMFHRHPEFMEYYTRFIGHFISIYSSKSPTFVRESARWSASPRNIQLYLEAGNMMGDVIGKTAEECMAALPVEERLYTGSKAGSKAAWPYDLRPL